MWIVPLLVVVAGAVLLAVLAGRVAREQRPTEQTLRLFGRTVRPALLRVRDETDRTQTRGRR
jgi:cytochrome c-type biogenesis protein CcmH/NrfF